MTPTGPVEIKCVRYITCNGTLHDPNDYQSLIGKVVTVQDSCDAPQFGRQWEKLVVTGELQSVDVNLYGDFLGCDIATPDRLFYVGPVPFSEPHTAKESMEILAGICRKVFQKHCQQQDDEFKAKLKEYGY